ncbi:MAG: hypothetical protein Athens071426_615 [Parcubacteria group bacterium Athens0714_26]|nr:MAG: hypothetical protein Athens071426_615 [Parcubacteria group bacterium Athens0714_26]
MENSMTKVIIDLFKKVILFSLVLREVMRLMKYLFFFLIFLLLAYVAYIDKPWKQWGYVDYAILAVFSAVILGAFLAASINDAKKKNIPA